MDKATEAWLSALTAFEVARRLIAYSGSLDEDVSAKVETGVQRIGSALGHRVESVPIACSDGGELLAYYLPATTPSSPGPAVICVSSEEETGAMLLGRLLPVVIGRRLSVLVISNDDVEGSSKFLLSSCFDYLSGRPEVDGSRIAIYGDGLSAVLATDFAAYDRRIAAAVCDGGVWSWTRSLVVREERRF
ncbi:hypothetical protein IVA80_23515 [Bradyrhizobium sp. 139]|uniref:hypothetical protein n=1 Tax=Bradyrhizobium sp. 139 TaxID=2782616 RepID=UPI001FF94F40|nr:hypothetical protein [Bradyrhizobium sp. 139]MCK1743735.1 hypothetical protein [Bradyrhizobium sp. 139]